MLYSQQYNAPVTEREIAARFRAIADILEIQGEVVFKVRAYRVAADTIDSLEDNELFERHESKTLKDLPGFGPAIVSKTSDFIETGTTAIWERVKDAVPEGVVELASIPGIGPRTAKSLWESLGTRTVEEVEEAAHTEKIRVLNGFGPAREAQLLEKIGAWRRLSEKLPRYKALEIANRLIADLKKIPGVESVEIGGDLRAGCDEVTRIALVVAPDDAVVSGAALEVPPVVYFIAAGDDVRQSEPSGLIEASDLRGELHEHTVWSDGKGTVREMAEAALKLGYAYLAITDHSPLVGVANGLNRERLLQQIDEVNGLRAEFAERGLQLLTGQEVDILQDGRLDMDDDVLALLDVVVASVHMRYKLSAAEMTARIVRALGNPHVDILGHPTGRLLGRREPYPLDIDAVIDAAKRNDKALEINSTPERMDLKDEHVQKAKAAGVKIVINCDAHAPDGLGDFHWGLCMARRAGLEAGDVINTWPWERLSAWLSR